MPAKDSVSIASTRQVELIFRKLQSISVLPQVGIRLLDLASAPELDRSQLAEVIESSPALSAKIFTVAKESNLSYTDNIPTVREAVEQMPENLLRQTILSAKTIKASSEQTPLGSKVVSREDVVINSIATAVCCEKFAELVGDPREKKLAFLAGLLLNVGKLAIDEALPKSYDKIVREAKLLSLSLSQVERKYLGTDHTIIGKRLCQLWGLPAEVVEAVWLYNNNTAVEVPGFGYSKLTKLAQLAYNIVRSSEFGKCGDFDFPQNVKLISEELGIYEQQVASAMQTLDQEVQKRAANLGLKGNVDNSAYIENLRLRASEFSQNKTKLEQENAKLKKRDFLNSKLGEMIAGISSYSSTIEAATGLVKIFKQITNCKSAAICLLNKIETGLLDAVSLSDDDILNEALLKIPDSYSARSFFYRDDIRKVFSCGFEQEWLFADKGVSVSKHGAKCLALCHDMRNVALVIFQPTDNSIDPFDGDTMSMLNSAAAILSMCAMKESQAELAEKFSLLTSELQLSQDKVAEHRSFMGIAEMAAGAAHELNNPLAVISGRAQILLSMEQDEEKRKMLEQIHQRSDEAHGMVAGLLDFARPKQPTKKSVNLRTILDQAINSVVKEKGIKELDVTFIDADDLPDVHVDSKQIEVALSNIVANAIESYGNENVGTIAVSKMADASQGYVDLVIADRGIGMEQQTIINATRPFYSAKTAGRSRGMGLAISNRLILLNDGLLRIESQVKSGTRVIVKLPIASKD